MKKTTDRRDFIKTASAVTAAASITPFACAPKGSRVPKGSRAPKGIRALETVNLGVVGTGGRGTGACNDSLTI
ncbi:MAG TPA: hypothetical protein DCX60_07260, partial [Phycisphaerales bacterium]|nr:hypothetical protein [Phycisphaerales bacterium]